MAIVSGLGAGGRGVANNADLAEVRLVTGASGAFENGWEARTKQS